MAGPMIAVKKEMRRRIREILQDLPEATAASQTAMATKALLSMPEYKAAQCISVYLSMPTGEINTSSIVRDALNQGKKVFIPYTYSLANPTAGQPKSIMDMLQLRSMEDFESFLPDKWGIPTPSKDSIESRANCFGGEGITNGASVASDAGLDLIVMPGMAFDVGFGRLGHGKGFYDYFLARCHHVSRMPRGSRSLTDRAVPPAE